MLSEALPDDIKNLIINTWDNGATEPEINQILPSARIRNAFMAEIGIIHTAPHHPTEEEVRDWLAQQYEIQTKAKLLQAKLQEIEPFTQEMAKSGKLPVWSFAPWAVTLMFDWSEQLGDAVSEAEAYLDGVLAL